MVKRGVMKNRRSTVADVADESGLSKYAVRNLLNNLGYSKRIARRKPMISSLNKRKRLQWAKKFAEQDMQFWSSIVWSDESKFCQFSNSGRIHVWRKTDEAWNADCLQGTVKHGGIGVMVWGAIWYDGKSELVFIENRLNGEKYNGILEKGLLPLFSVKLDKNQVLFQEDGAPCHTSRVSQRWKNDHGIKCLEWVAQSPDLNPIEHVWEHLDRKIRARKTLAKSVTDLKQILMDEWEKLDLPTIRKLIESMPERVKTVLTTKGGPTKY